MSEDLLQDTLTPDELYLLVAALETRNHDLRARLVAQVRQHQAEIDEMCDSMHNQYTTLLGERDDKLDELRTKLATDGEQATTKFRDLQELQAETWRNLKKALDVLQTPYDDLARVLHNRARGYLNSIGMHTPGRHSWFKRRCRDCHGLLREWMELEPEDRDLLETMANSAICLLNQKYHKDP